MPLLEETHPVKHLDYSLVGEESSKAVERGLAEATWYTCPISKENMRQLLRRRDAPAIRDTVIWFALLIGFAVWAIAWWPSLWSALPLMLFAVIYASTSDSRWHEAGHGTAFKTDWMNNALYEMASFMVMRESTVWRWSHTRHHSDTIIVGRDPEIAVPRPPDLLGLAMAFFNLKVYPAYFKSILTHSFGKMGAEESTFIPESEHGCIFFKARIYVLIYASVIGVAIYLGSILPLLFIGLSNLYGSWLMVIYGLTQHAGLAENVLDHRLNCRTVSMNFIHRYLYWNMNYHLEHHMFPLVPYHNLAKLHRLIKDDCPVPYRGLIEAYAEIIPAVFRQVKDPAWHVKRELPAPGRHRDAIPPSVAHKAEEDEDADGWVVLGDAGLIEREDVIRLDHNLSTYAVYRTLENEYYATDGICTHGNTHLADGFVKGKLIECPKHNGRFDMTNGSPVRLPVCVALKTYPVKVEGGKILIDLKHAGGEGAKETHREHAFKVIGNRNVATFIKELTLEPVEPIDYQPGQYLQFRIPAYGDIQFGDIEVAEPYAKVWREQHLFELKSTNPAPIRRNYSLATNPAEDRHLRFNVRIATPPRGQQCPAGAGSAWMHHLKEGDNVTAIGPFGDFLIKDTDKEMIYLGGGAGMAPLRSHLSHLFNTLKTGRKVSFWYGARSLQEMFYQEDFKELAKTFDNFAFHVALSEPQPEDNWSGPTGFIHDVLKREYLDNHAAPSAIEYYLCGPPAMVQAATDMLEEDFAIAPHDIAYDKF